MTVWFTSDVHFFHKNAYKFCPKTRLPDINESNMMIIDAINDSVKAEDTLYILGDLSFGRPDETAKLLDKIVCRNRYLVKGNHDTFTDQFYDKHFTHVAHYMKHTINGHKVMMFHYPIMEWDSIHYGSFHLHGHLHGKDSGVGGRIMDMGWDCEGKIFSFDEIEQRMLQKEVRKHH